MTRSFLLSIALVATVVLAGCSAQVEASGDADGGTTPTKDGAKGKCCVPHTGGCADVGGYREDGDCSQGSLCDNMCEQRIVDDVHGCQKMVYKSPPVTTTYAGTGSCSDPVYNGQNPFGKDAGDAGDASDAGDESDGG